MPPLIESEHPQCADLITAYKQCSASASLLSKVLFSECTTLKYKLDDCFRQEKIARTQQNIAKSKVSRDLYIPRGREYTCLCPCLIVHARIAYTQSGHVQVLRQRILQAKRDREASLAADSEP